MTLHLTTATGSLALLVRVTDPLYALLGPSRAADEPTPIYAEVIGAVGPDPSRHHSGDLVLTGTVVNR